MDLAAWGTYQFELFILVFFRVLGLFVAAPLFGSGTIPVKLKILFSLLIAVVVFPGVPREGVAVPGAFGGLVFAVGGEMAIGFIIGFSANLLMSAIQLGGHWVGQQIGLTLANVIDPISNNQLSVIEQFKFIFAMLIFLALNGHHYLLRALEATFRILPVRGLTLAHINESGAFIVFDMGSEMFAFAIKVAAPFIVALLVTTVAMGFIAKSVPEINIFIIGFGVRIIVGFGILFVALPALAVVFEKIFYRMAADIDHLVFKILAA